MENIVQKLQKDTEQLSDMIVDVVSDLQHTPNAKLSKQNKHDLKKQTETYLKQQYKKITDGAKAIGDAIHTVGELHRHEKEIQNALISAVQELSKQKDVENWAMKGFEKGKDSFAKLFDISDEILGYMYQAAKHYFDHKDYVTAAKAFSFLTLVHPSVHDFWMGLAASEALDNHPTEAIISFGMAACTNPNSPLPHLYAAECYEKIHDVPMAEDALHYALEMAKEHKEYKHLVPEITHRLASIKRK